MWSIKCAGLYLKMAFTVELIINETTELFVAHECIHGISGIFALVSGSFLSALSAGWNIPLSNTNK